MRKDARVGAFQVLFGLDQGNNENDETLSMIVEENDLHDKDVEYVEHILKLFAEHKLEIDQQISDHLNKQWTISRLGSVERTILRLGVLEILYQEDVPKNVAINEAVELTKCFADEQSKRLINGILDKIG
ncbi:transcription antitermination factor NusB [Clostridia bacterium]|nr:transcription antitermination factor NusB [Clostridia bacterium]